MFQKASDKMMGRYLRYARGESMGEFSRKLVEELKDEREKGTGKRVGRDDTLKFIRYKSAEEYILAEAQIRCVFAILERMFR